MCIYVHWYDHHSAGVDDVLAVGPLAIRQSHLVPKSMQKIAFEQLLTALASFAKVGVGHRRLVMRV
jgi:hypothetical protein